MPAFSSIDFDAQYNKMRDHISRIMKTFDESFCGISTYYKLDASHDANNDEIVIPTGDGMMLKEFEASSSSSGNRAPVVSLHIHNRGSSALEVAEVVEPLDKLRSLLANAVPKEISERLLAAATQGHADFYTSLDKDFLNFLKQSLLDLLRKCERQEIPSDTKRKILSFLSQHHMALPTAIIVEISEIENAQKAALAAEQDMFRILVEETTKANDVSKLIREMDRNLKNRQYDHTIRVKARISEMIQNTVSRLVENLKAGHFVTVIMTLASTWDDWSTHCNYCVGLSEDKKFRKQTNYRYSVHSLRDANCDRVIMKLINSVIEIIRMYHSEAHTIAVEKPQVFSVLTNLIEKVEALLDIRGSNAYNFLNECCQSEQLDHLIEEIILKFPTAFIHYSSAIEGTK